MTTITIGDATDLHTEVQRFYARQVHLLDGCAFEEYAATYTEDGEFIHTPGVTPARGRAAIAAELTRFHERFAENPVQRRHWFNAFVVDPIDAKRLSVRYYALILNTRPGVKQPDIGPSCVVHDELVRIDGELYTRRRRVDHDDLLHPRREAR